MKGRAISIRMTDAEYERLCQIQELRNRDLAETHGGLLRNPESISDLIRLAILRFYNDTWEYYMYEREDFLKFEGKEDSVQ